MKVTLKSEKEFKKMVRNKEIDFISVSDSGEIHHFGTKGNPSHILTLWFDDFGKEYLVVDHPNPISKQDYENRKIFFKESL